MTSVRKLSIWGFLALAAALLVFLALRPSSVQVDMAAVARGPLQVTIGEEGRTRVKEVYVVSAPITGRLLRIGLRAGDGVEANATVVARIQPADPAFLDVRTRAQAEATVRTAEAALALAEAERARVRAELDYAEGEAARVRPLAAKGTASQAQLDRAELALRSQRAALETAQANVRVKASELETARAHLLAPTEERGGDLLAGPDAATLPVIAPVAGKVLQVLQESETVVAAGTPLVEIGDPRNLEIVVDLLSSDAVRVREGATVLIDAWGGAQELRGRVRRVEPFGYTKVSALGIEEQRVNVIVDLTSPPAEWTELGHGFRIEARIVTWEEENVLQVPLSALFRTEGKWTVFRVQDGVARPAEVEIGAMNAQAAQIRSGLEEGETVVLYPSDKIGAGTRVRQRPS
ncbi:MAG: HlyD family efflux transporter periplasmic adaptor subunit [Alphaproteobacteria bacterium]|nr:HlyD family efflux transporter periplasmic adaptor subunit [Alphaproteobacteria bacterium]